MTTNRDTLQLADGTNVLWNGPSTAKVHAALTKAGYRRATPPKRAGGMPGVGYTARKIRDTAYVEVGATMSSSLSMYRRVLESAGFVVLGAEDGVAVRPGLLAVFSRA